jgi:CheY-like chemotaxis protein
MKTIIIIDRVRQVLDADFFQEMSNADVELITAYSNADVVNLHGRERASLIITELYGSGMNALQLCDVLRDDAELRGVSVIVFCRDNEIERNEATKCRANAVLTLPPRRFVFRRKATELLNISTRGRFQASFSARPSSGDIRSAITCRIENISVTGMLIEAEANLKPGETLQCSLAIPPTSAFSTEAQVIRIDRGNAQRGLNRYGMRFSGFIPAGVRRAIENIVTAHPRP